MIVTALLEAFCTNHLQTFSQHFNRRRSSGPTYIPPASRTDQGFGNRAALPSQIRVRFHQKTDHGNDSTAGKRSEIQAFLLFRRNDSLHATAADSQT